MSHLHLQTATEEAHTRLATVCHLPAIQVLFWKDGFLEQIPKRHCGFCCELFVKVCN